MQWRPYSDICVVFSFLLVLGCLQIWRVSSWQKEFSPKFVRLRQYNVNPKSVTVSGISNGAGFAVHLSFIYSSLIRGIGVFSGSPYPLAYMVYNKQLTSLVNMNDYIEHIDRWSAEGAIDSVENLKGFRAYVYHGIKDYIVPQLFQINIIKEFSNYGAIIKPEIATVLGGHCMPTTTCCNYLPQLGSVQAVCYAGYQGVNHMFHFFFGRDFVWPIRDDALPTGLLFKFDQNEFFPFNFAEGYGMNTGAFIYVPKLCELGKVKCKLHLAFHGFGLPLAARIASDGHNDFIHGTGYLQAADANNIIVLFPETLGISVGWDFIGFYGKDYNFKNGTHVLAIARMIRRIVYGTQELDIQDHVSPFRLVKKLHALYHMNNEGKYPVPLKSEELWT